MKMLPRDLMGRSALASVLIALVFLSSPARAQLEEDAEASSEPPSSPSESESDSDNTSGAAEESGEAQVEASATTGIGTKAEVEVSSPASADTAKPKPAPLALELLPSAAFPGKPIPGIPQGSLSQQINHLQWPYMPEYEGQPKLRIGLSGNSWLDSNFRQIRAGDPREDDQTEYRMQGRLTFRVSPVYNHGDGYFLQSNIEFIAISEQDHAVTNYVDVDEAWVRFGRWKQFDITVGRTQGFEVYHFGMGLDLNTYERQGAVSRSNTPPPPYALTELWDRGVSNGAVAAHWYGPDWLRLEMLLRFGLSGNGTDVGIRPVGVLDFGWVKLKAGYERRLQPALLNTSDARVETQGLGANLQFVFAPWVEFGGGAAHRVVDAFEDDGAPRPGASTTTLTYGGFLNVRPYFENWMVGVGYHFTEMENFNFDSLGRREYWEHTQMFGAVQYVLWDRLYLKYVLGYADGLIRLRNDTDPDNDGFHNKALSHRLRVQLFF